METYSNDDEEQTAPLQEGVLENIEQDESDLVEKINPDELQGEKRDDYLNRAWELFQARAEKGLADVESVEDMCHRLGVEGASEESITKHAQPDMLEHGFSFDDMIELFDQISRSSTENYRDTMEHAAASEEVVFLTPLKYLWYKLPCVTKDDKVAYKLDTQYSVEMTPKRILLSTTTVLLVISAALLLVIVGSLWMNHRAGSEVTQVREIRTTIFQLAELYERLFYLEHEDELMDQTSVIADLSDALYRERMKESQNRERGMTRLFMLSRDVQEVLDRQRARVETFDQMVKLNATFDETIYPKLEALGAMKATNSTNVQHCNATELQTTTVASLSAFTQPHPDMPAPEGYYCVYGNADDWYAARRRQVTNLLDEIAALGRLNRTYSLFAKVTPDAPFTPQTARAKEQCVNLDNEDLCVALKERIAEVPPGGEVSVRVPGLLNESSFVSIVRSDDGLAAMVSTVFYERFVDVGQQRYIDAVQYLNWQFARSTEVVLGRQNRTTGAFNTQATSFRFSEDCWEGCSRSPPSTRNAVAAFEAKGKHFGITPDYRPEPVDGAAQWMSELEMVLLLERDVAEIRELGMQSLVVVMNRINTELSGDTEIELFKLEGTPFMKTFNPYEPCGENEDCDVLPDPIGVYFRYDCSHCSRFVPIPPENATVEFLTKRKKSVASEQQPNPIYFNTIQYKRTFTDYFQDYSGDEVYGESAYIANYSVGIVVKSDENDMTGTTLNKVYQSVGVAAGILFVGLVTLLFLSNRALNAIQDDWKSSKAKIEADRERFGELVGDMIPPAAAEKMMKGHRMISESHNASSVMFADLCGFSEWCKGFTPRQTIRLLSYTFVVLEAAAEECGMSRLNTIGDTYVAYKLSDLESKKDPMTHPAMRAARFAALAAQIYSPLFSHFPEKARYFRDAFKDRFRSQIPYKLPPIRFGGHSGTLIASVVDTGRAPRFDCYGLAPSLASRMVATALPYTIHVTSIMKEILINSSLAADKTRKLFSFDDPRKTIVRGQGTITSYFIATTTFEVPIALLNKLAVQRAKVLFCFEKAFSDRRGSNLNSLKIHHSMSSSDTHPTRSSKSETASEVSGQSKRSNR